MPPRTRTRVTKVLKENIEVVKKNTLKSSGKVTKPPRKALADKTNSLSDDNASIDIPIKTTKLKSKASKTKTDDNVRPRRDRRLPPRYLENQMLKNLSNSKDSPVKQNHATSKAHSPSNISSEKSMPGEAISKDKKMLSKVDTHVKQGINNKVLSIKSPSHDIKKLPKSDKQVKSTDKLVTSIKLPSKKEKITAATRPRRNCRLQSSKEKPVSKENSNLDVPSPFKTPSKDLESSLVANRPKRICRLPSKFEDHSISPNKFIPVQPCHASTPLLQKNTKTINSNAQNFNIQDKKKVTKTSGKSTSTVKPTSEFIQITKSTKINVKGNSSNSSMDKNSPDSNNNGKNKIVRAKRANFRSKLQTKQVSPEANKMTPFAKRLLDKSFSFRILEDKKQSKDNEGDNIDVYDFTFDPNEEPQPQKKKRKRTVKKKPAKPKIALKSNYNLNVWKAIDNLIHKVKPSQTNLVQNNVKPTDDNVKPTVTEKAQNTQSIANHITTNDILQKNNHSTIPPVNESAKTSIHESNYASICVEDIAADFDLSNHNVDINYSPVNSPNHPQTPEPLDSNVTNIAIQSNNPILNKDPLKLQEDLSFFDEHPVASSSMNVSVRDPIASPWRVEFRNLPMRWHSNSYVKPNMTPAVESSFINTEDSTTKKHVYTNMVPEKEPLPEIVESNAPNLVQTSIISYIKEIAERSAKKRRRSQSHTKEKHIFDDIHSTLYDFENKIPKKAKKTTKKSTPNSSNNSNDRSNDRENSNEFSNKSRAPVEALKEKDKDCTYFGFDESENLDQENVSPVKEVPNTRTRGLRYRAVLKNFNAQVDPTRALIPVAAKAKMTSSEVVEQLYDQLKSAEDAPQCPEKETAKEPLDNTVATNVNNPARCEEVDDDSQSVHLFEDIEFVNHLKHHMKSYSKPKKVTFQRPSDSDSNTQLPAVEDPAQSSDDDDLADLTFQMPVVKQKRPVKKKKPKKQLTKEEKKEVEEWAAHFNSMCEDVDEFPLVVE